MTTPKYVYVDGDAHILEPRDLWERYLEPKYRARAPKVVTNPNGLKGDWWVTENLRPVSATSGGLLGATRDIKKLEEAQAEAKLDEFRLGGWDPAWRLKDMAVDNVGGGVMYPTNSGTLYSLTDVQFQAACFRAYNNWIGEFNSHDPKRLAGVALIPNLDVDEAVKEIKRTAKLGFKGGLIDASVDNKLDGYGDLYWEPMWQAFEDTGMIASFHTFNGKFWWPQDHDRRIQKIAINMDYPIRRSLIEMVFWGVFDRHPKLKVIVAEFRIGWLPHFLWALDDRFKTRSHWRPMCKKLPREYWNTQCWVVTLHEPELFMNSLPFIGEDRMLWSTDYPHIESTWPKSQEALVELMPGASASTIKKVARDNAARLYGFTFTDLSPEATKLKVAVK